MTVLDALKLVVMCICVGLCGSGLCKQGAVPFHLHPDFLYRNVMYSGF